jgi:hypothetical protein
MVNLVFSNARYQVLEYPELDAFELVDARRGTGGFIQGAVARVFRLSMEGLLGQEVTEQDVEGVIENFDAVMTQPLRYH